jgi:ankyrin repeat protein
VFDTHPLFLTRYNHNVVLQSHVCDHYDLKHFVHVTQCVFSKLMQDEDGDTPLIIACRWGHVETARVLLDHGANVDQQNNVSE